MDKNSITLHEILPDEFAYQDILEERFVVAFPEYAGVFPSIRSDIRSGGNHLPGTIRHHWLILRDSKAIGFALFSYLINSNIGFFRYLSVDSKYRGEGIGVYVIQELKNRLCLDARELGKPDPLCYCFEVENPDLARSEKERQIDQYRLEYFVKKRGALVLNVDYMEPVLVRDKNAVVPEKPKPMYLLVQPIDPNLVEVDPQTTYKWVAAVYFEHYRLDPADPTAKMVLSSIPNTEV